MLTTPERGSRLLTSEIIGRESLAALLPQWKALSERSADDNAYYSPAYAMALLETVSAKDKVRFLTVRDGASLVAFLPFQTSPMRWPPFGVAGLAWQSPHTYTCAPLLDRDLAYETADTLVTALMSMRPGTWMFPRMNTGSTTVAALVAAFERRLLKHRFIEPFKRAVVGHGPSFDEHLKKNVASKRRRELARNRRRLSEVGHLRHRFVTGGPDLEKAVEAFLSIEAAGWKGHGGTALQCRPDSLAFARKAFTENPGCMADMLLLDDKPIAVSLMVKSGRTGFTVKCAYDETYRNYGAGLLLEEDALRNFLDGNFVDRLDSGTNGSHVIDGLWPESIEVGDLMFSVNPQASDRAFNAVVKTELLRRRAKDYLKRILRRD